MFIFERDRVASWSVCEKALSAEECQFLIDYGNKQQKEVAELTSKVDLSYRKNKVVWFEPVSELKDIYNKISDIIIDLNRKFFNLDLYGFTEKIQFTEYSEYNDNYNLHIDKLYGDVIRKLSIVIQLSKPEDYEGCNLEIYNSATPEVMNKNQGTLIAFPSYSLHKVTPLISGTRYSLVAWIGGPSFR